jgi:hypothetical protein
MPACHSFHAGEGVNQGIVAALAAQLILEGPRGSGVFR